jgi:putative DNA primase/helicase
MGDFPLPSHRTDPLASFIASRCVVNSKAQAMAGDLYGAYLAWCAENGELPLVQRSFGMRLTELGLAT